MRRHKFRYKSGQTIHQGFAPKRILSGDPPYCRDDVPFQENRLWLSEYEIMEYSHEKMTQFNDCNHVLITGLPRSVSSYDECKLLHEDGSGYCTAYGQHIDSYLLEAAMPHTGLPYSSQGKRYDSTADNEDRLGGPILEYIYDNVDMRVDKDEAAARAFKKFKQRTTDFRDLSIPNFLYELKDTIKMMREFRSLAQIGSWPTYVKWQLTKRDLDRFIADKYLTYQFGIAPLVRDIVAILKALGSLRQRLKKILSELHMINVIGTRLKDFKVPKSIDTHIWQCFGTPHCDGMADYSQPAGAIHHQLVEDFIPSAYLTYTLYCEDLSKLNLELRYALETFGVSWEPDIIYNAIPFSFILDWIYDVGGWIEDTAAKWKPFPVKLRFLDFCLQWKYKSRFYLDTEHVNVTDQPGPDPDIVSSTTSRHIATCERFFRTRFQPDVKHLIRAKWDKKFVDKTLLGAALVKTNILFERKLFRVRRRFGPSERTIANIAKRAGLRQQSIKRISERLSAKVNRQRIRREERAKQRRRRPTVLVE